MDWECGDTNLNHEITTGKVLTQRDGGHPASLSCPWDHQRHPGGSRPRSDTKQAVWAKGVGVGGGNAEAWVFNISFIFIV